MSTGMTVLIVAVVVVAAVVVIGMILRSKRQQNRSSTMNLPEIGALSTDGLTKANSKSTSEDGSPEQQTPRQS